MVTFGAFVLTYRRPEGLRQSLDFLLGQTRRPDRIWVIDNADDPVAKEITAGYALEGVRYHATGRNLGSAGGVSTGLELMVAAGCDWVLSIDDDDVPTWPESSVTVERLEALIERQDHGDLGVVGAIGSRFDWRTGEHVRIPDEELNGDLAVDIVGGGSFFTVSRRLIEQIGPPNKEFFFGHYDPLYCLEAGRRGFRVMIDGDLLRVHRQKTGNLGATAQRNTVVSQIPEHALWRRYYVTRNYIYAMRRTFDEPRLARRMALRALAKSVLAFGRGARYGRRFTVMQVRGVIDGYRGRLGATVAPVTKPQPGGPVINSRSSR